MIEQQNLTRKQAAKYLGISEATLRLWSTDGKGPRHFKAGEKLVRYRRTDLDSWIEERLSATVAQAGPNGNPTPPEGRARMEECW